MKMIMIKRQILASTVLSTAFLASLAARQLGVVGVGSTGDGLDVLLLFGAFCFGCAAIVTFLLRGSRRDKPPARDAIGR